MTEKQIIDGLQFTIDMILFDPSTGETVTKDRLNDDNRLTVDACEGAIKLIKSGMSIEVDGKALAIWLRQLKGYKTIRDQVAFAKRNIKSENSDYLTGYLSALSAVEGMIAEVEE